MVSTVARKAPNWSVRGNGVGQSRGLQPEPDCSALYVHNPTSRTAGPAERKVESGAAVTGRLVNVLTPGSTTSTREVPAGTGGKLVITCSCWPARCRPAAPNRRSVHRHSSAPRPASLVVTSRARRTDRSAATLTCGPAAEIGLSARRGGVASANGGVDAACKPRPDSIDWIVHAIEVKLLLV